MILPAITWVGAHVVYTAIGGIGDSVRLACWWDDGVVSMVTLHSDAKGFGGAKVSFP